MGDSVSFNLLNLGGLKIGNHASFSYSAGAKASKEQLVGAAEIPLPFLSGTASPSAIALLSWHTELTKFVGREAQFADLRQWSGAPQTVSVKILVGEGGVGKSRLAAEFCRELRSQGWSAGFVNVAQPATYRVSAIGALLVIDYPEEDVEAVVSFLSQLARSEYPAKLRVLLLSRMPAEQWLGKFDLSNAVDIIDMSPISIEHMDAEDLFKIFYDAVEGVSSRFDTVPLPVSFSAFSQWVASAPENSIPLFVLACGAHAALNPDDHVVQYSGREVVISLVKREVRRLSAMAKAAGWAADSLARLMGLATLPGKIGGDFLSSMLLEEEFAVPSPALARDYLEEIGIITSGCIHAPKPDIMAAVLLVYIMRDSKNAVKFICGALECVPDIHSRMARLARVVADEQKIFQERESFVVNCVKGYVSGNKSWIGDLIEYFTEANIPHALLGLDEFVWRELATLSPEPRIKSGALNNLAFCLMSRKAYGEAIYAIQEAIEIDTAYPSLHGDGSKYELGLKTMNLSRALCEMGEFDRAIDGSRRAVGLVEKYAEMPGGVGEHARVTLAVLYDILARSLQNVGDVIGGLEYVAKAVELLEALSSLNWDEYAPELATKIMNMGVAKGNADDFDGAHAAMVRAEDILREYCAKHPGIAENELAGCLNNDAALWARVGDHQRSLDLLSEASEIWNTANVVSGGAFRHEVIACHHNAVKSSYCLGEYLVTERHYVKLIEVASQAEEYKGEVEGFLIDAARVAILLATPEAVSRFRNLVAKCQPSMSADYLIARGSAAKRMRFERA